MGMTAGELPFDPADRHRRLDNSYAYAKQDLGVSKAGINATRHSRESSPMMPRAEHHANLFNSR